MEENRTVTQIIGDRANAPYMNTLADGGVRMGAMYAIRHPSQPNYIHLFSGSNQGVTDDNLPPNFSTTPTGTFPFQAPNLGAEIIAAGFTFAGYCEQIEAAGTNDWADYDPHSATDPGIYYRRKHNPWANWIAKVQPLPANQLPAAVNRSFAQFPTNYSQLPTVSFVIPNQLHDMHDGSRKQGDDWLQANLGGYAAWARTNNSLLIITWDEDDYNGINQIPTIFYGAGLREGTVAPGTWTLHNLLRTIEDMYASTSHAGAAAQLNSIVGPFADDPPVTNVTFRQGVAGYAGAADTWLSEEIPATPNGTAQDLVVDLDTSSSVTGNQEGQGLIRFTNLFGAGAGLVPTNAIIHSAKLICYTPTNSGSSSEDIMRVHRMLIDWDDTATWNSLTAGVSANGVEAASGATFSLAPSEDGTPAIFDVTSDVELFRKGTPNRGWLIRASTSGTGNGWTFRSSEAAVVTQRPSLEIVYSMPTPYSTWAAARGLTALNNALNLDPDNDGIPNVSEFAYNLNPLVPDRSYAGATGTNGLPWATFLPNVSGGVLEMSYVRRRGTTAPGLTYTPTFSGDLSAWATGQVPTITPLNPDWERVTVRDSVTGLNSKRFGRVGVSLLQQ